MMFKYSLKTILLLFLIALVSYQCTNNRSDNSENNNSASGKNDTIVVRDTFLVDKETEPAVIRDTITINKDSDPVVVRDTLKLEQKSLTLRLDNMNIMYVGVANEIFLETNGMPGLSLTNGLSAHDVKLSISGGGGKLKMQNRFYYHVFFDSPGEAVITAIYGNQKRSFKYNVKRIPDPVAMLGGSTGGTIGSGNFRKQEGLQAILKEFEFNVQCEIVGFSISYIPKRADPIEVNNSGDRFTSAAQNLIKRAKPGDTYLFTNIKARCPGDKAGRSINTMVFIIK